MNLFIGGFMFGALAALLVIGISIEVNRRMTEKTKGVLMDELLKESVLETPLQDAPLPARVKNALFIAQIYTIADLVKYRREDMLKFRNFGKTSLEHLSRYIDDQDVVWE